MLRAIETHLIRKAGLTRSSGARSGAITFIQRFGSALNLNVHLHMLIPDRIYTLSHGKPRFHAVTAPSQSELTTLLNHIIRRITRQLTRDGLLAQEAEQPYLDLQIEDTLDQFGAASLQYRVILGPNTGSRVLTLRNPVSATPAGSVKPFTVARDGFSLNAAVSCQVHQRKKLERLCRYVARPPLALERLLVTDEGKLRYAAN
ncbi:MAG: transposase [Pseudomonadaceae bacterium]|nr:transposase [Pseudomonadaceae bacterium]